MFLYYQTYRNLKRNKSEDLTNEDLIDAILIWISEFKLMIVKLLNKGIHKKNTTQGKKSHTSYFN